MLTNKLVQIVVLLTVHTYTFVSQHNNTDQVSLMFRNISKNFEQLKANFSSAHASIFNLQAFKRSKLLEDDGSPIQVMSFNPINQLPIIIFVNESNQPKIALLDLATPLTTFALPILIRGVKHLYPLSGINQEILVAAIKPENKFACHSFISTDSVCFAKNINKDGEAIHVAAAFKYNIVDIDDFKAPYKESRSFALPVGLEYTENATSGILGVKEMVGLSPAIKGESIKSVYLNTMFGINTSLKKNFKITSTPKQTVRIQSLKGYEYDVILPKVDVGVDEKVENYEFSGELKKEDNTYYLEKGSFTFDGVKSYDNLKVVFDTQEPGIGIPKSVFSKIQLKTQVIGDEMMQIQEIGSGYYIFQFRLDHLTKMDVKIGNHQMNVELCDIVAGFGLDQKKYPVGVIVVKVLEEEGKVVLGSLFWRRYSLLFDLIKGRLGIKKDN